MKIIYFIFSLSFIIEIFCYNDNRIEYTFESGVTQTLSIKKNITYYAYIEADSGKDVKIEIAMDYSSHQTSPFTILQIEDRTDIDSPYKYYDAKFSEDKKNNQLIITINHHMGILSGIYTSLLFVSSCDISKLQIKMTISGFSTKESISELSKIFFIFIYGPIIAAAIGLIIIIVYCIVCGMCCSAPPKPKPNYELSAQIQPPNETNEIYSINEAQQNNPSS